MATTFMQGSPTPIRRRFRPIHRSISHTAASKTPPFPSDSIRKKRIEDFMPIATGHEREELEAELQGKNILDINLPEGPFGIMEAPAIVKSVYDKRIVGSPCVEGEDEHDVVWFWLEKGKPHKCPVCSQCFKLGNIRQEQSKFGVANTIQSLVKAVSGPRGPAAHHLLSSLAELVQCHGNCSEAVRAGPVPVLIHIVESTDGEDLGGTSLAILGLLAWFDEGLNALRKQI